MSLRDEIVPFIDGNGLVAPKAVPLGFKRGSDNGPMFTSEYYIILNRNGLLTEQDKLDYVRLIQACIDKDGYLRRCPGDTAPDEIDDHLGVLAGYAELGIFSPFKLPLRLWRFPQLLEARYPLELALLILTLSITVSPLFLLVIFITPLIIATSCIGVPKDQADPRRLNWLLWQATKRHDLLCNLAGKFWAWRQKKVYGTEHYMRAIASYYYQQNDPTHPFIKYWME